jgi:hypothetical protein
VITHEIATISARFASAALTSILSLRERRTHQRRVRVRAPSANPDST